MRRNRFTALLLTFLTASSLIFQIPVCGEYEEDYYEYEEYDDASYEEGAEATDVFAGNVDEGVTTDQIAGWPAAPEITSPAAIVIEESTGHVLYAKNMNNAYYPSSSVKIMTCLVALEHSSPLDEVGVNETGVAGATEGGANIAAQIDEIFTVEQCLYAIMLASANDMALQLAEHISGSVDSFVEMMNQKAAELGCTNTLFTNPTGLPDPEGTQHTSAHDMALIIDAAMQNETFRQIASTLSYTIPPTNMSGGERVLTNMFTMIDPANDAYYEGCLGGKEGFTTASGSVLVCAAERNDMRLYCAVMNGQADQTDDEAITILDYAFNNFKFMDVGSDDFSVIEGGELLVPVSCERSDIEMTDTPTEGNRLDRRYFYNGTEVGSAVAEVVVEEDDSVAIAGRENMDEAMAYSAEKDRMPYYLIGAGGILAILLLIFLMVRVWKGPKKKES